MNARHDEDDFARMIAAQANLRARLIALRLALPNPYGLRSCRPPWPAADGDEPEIEVVWLESAAEQAGGMVGCDEGVAALARRRCA
jgi:hypothetical protein